MSLASASERLIQILMSAVLTRANSHRMSQVVCSFRMHPRPHAHMMLIPHTNTECEYEYTIRTLPPTPSCPAIRIRNPLFITAPKLPLSSCSHLISTSLPVQIRNKEYGMQKGHQRRLQEIRNSAWNYGAQNTKRKHVSPRLLHRADGPSISYWLHFLSLAFISK